MSTPNFIENIRSKPKAHKKRIQIIFSIAITFVIAVFWAFSFGSQVRKIVDAEKANKEPSPFRVLANSFMSIFSNIEDGVNITAERLKGEEDKNKSEGADVMYIKD